MSKITRAYQKIFGGTGVTSDFGKFGSLAISDPTTTKDPATIQSLPAWLGGWAQATIGALIPAYQDMNSINYLSFYQICYLLQMGIAEWDNQTSYYIGSIVQYNGLLYTSLQDDSVNQEPDTQTSYWQQGLPGAEITGVIKQFAGVIAPAGYFICDGAAKNRSTYAGLFAVCGTIYGIGDGSTTFNIPDLREKIPVGYKSGDSDFGTLGQTGGEKTHLLTSSESGSPAHTHVEQSLDGGSNIGYGVQGNPGAGNTVREGYVSTKANSPADAASAHNNLQPYLTLNNIIKY